MSFVKLPKTCSDHAVGLDSVNQALANNRALYFDQLDPWHAAGVRSAADRQLGPGRHDDILIARSVADFSIRDIFGLGVTAVAQVGGPFIVGFPTRLAAGQWRVYVTVPRIFSAAATIKGASTGVARYATCFVSTDVSGPFVTVSTWNATTGALADYDFSLSIWSEGVA